MTLLPQLEPLRRVHADELDVTYHDAGPPDGPPVLLLHGFPYDVHSFVDVIGPLAKAGHRVLVPYLRGHGPTRFHETATPRSGQQAALGRDVVAFMDALDLQSAVLAGFDWGGRAACVSAALWPERCDGVVTVNGYLIQDIANAMTPVAPEIEAGLWYFFYFLTERGRLGLQQHRRDVARVIWARNSPEWTPDRAVFERAAAAFDNPDFVDVVIHSYRHRLGAVPGAPRCASAEARLARQPPITVPAVTLDGMADGNFPPTDGTSSAHHFVGPRVHHQVPHAGHNLPQEAPDAFVDAVLEVVALGRR